MVTCGPHRHELCCTTKLHSDKAVSACTYSAIRPFRPAPARDRILPRSAAAPGICGHPCKAPGRWYRALHVSANIRYAIGLEHRHTPLAVSHTVPLGHAFAGWTCRVRHEAAEGLGAIGSADCLQIVRNFCADACLEVRLYCNSLCSQLGPFL